MVTLQVTLSDETFKRFQRLSQVTGLDLETILNAMPLLSAALLQECDTTPVASLSDDALMLLAASRMSSYQAERMSHLHERQQNTSLTPLEQEELQILMGVYQAGQLRKAEALVEAYERGLNIRGLA